MEQVTLRARDTLDGAAGQCFVTLGGNRYNFMQMYKLEVTFKKKKKDVPILGKPGGGKKTVGYEITGKGTMHYNTSVFRRIAKHYQDTGEDIDFTMQITNQDKGSKAGRQTIILNGCNLDDITLAKFDADGKTIDEEVQFTAESFTLPEEFTDLDGFLASLK